jgi:hypothetical protein
VFRQAHIPYILTLHLQIDKDPDPTNHFADADTDPAYHIDADPVTDTNFQFNADPCGCGSIPLTYPIQYNVEKKNSSKFFASRQIIVSYSYVLKYISSQLKKSLKKCENLRKRCQTKKFTNKFFLISSHGGLSQDLELSGG